MKEEFKQKKNFNIETWENIDDALKNDSFECAFVCTSPLSHSEIIEKCLKNGINVFSEINLVSKGYEKNIAIAKENKLLLFMSSTMIYRDEMTFIQKNLNKDYRYAYRYHVGQYLPDWHPWESYKDYFVGQKETNGCREILAIELPWISDIFGKIKSVECIKNRITTLDIDFNDTYMILITHENGNIGSLIVDVVACEPIRDLKIIGENYYLSWNGTPDSLFVKRGSSDNLTNIKLYETVEHQEGYNNTIVENEYVNELKQFFDELNKTCSSRYNFEDDSYILSIIDKVEEIC